MRDLKKIYLDLCMSTVFRAVTEKPLLRHFFDLCRAQERDEKTIAYAAFVHEIYTHGGSLTDCVAQLIFEDENVYVKARATGADIAPEISAAKSHELSVFEELAALEPCDFARELDTDYVSPFSSKKISLSTLYENRMKDISRFGYGIFSRHPMFRLGDGGTLEPIVSADKTTLDKFIGYSEERGRVIANTEAFLAGKAAANVLLCGDAGTGKSSTVKAIANRYFDEGLRLVELRKDQLGSLPSVMGSISENPLRFIIFIDDLSFNQNDDNFSMLKAALEGSASAKAANALIYATSNRRHIVRESFSDRDGDDLHRNDTMQETLSLSERFGLVVHFARPDKRLYLEIVRELARRRGINTDKAELDIMAEAFALRRGSRSARCAEQFIDSLS